MKTTTYTVPRIRCEGCASTIVEALSGLVAVDQVTVDVAARTVTVHLDDTHGDEDLRGALAAAGFPAE